MIEAQWMVWRLVVGEKLVTLQELDTHWSTVDLYRAHLACDYYVACDLAR